MPLFQYILGLFFQPMITPPNSSPSMDMEWSADGENTDISNTSSPNASRSITNPDPDSFSDDDDFSDEFSIIDSDDDRRTEGRFTSHQLMQVIILFELVIFNYGAG